MELNDMVDWDDIRKLLSLISIIIGAIAASLPEPYSKIAFAAALGLSNAAIFLRKDANGARSDSQN